ncbi:MAG: hypothetical protein ACYCSN_13575 [Acidobacteriaceae bacterium]
MQNTIAVAPPLPSTFPLQFSPGGSWPSGIGTVEVDNGSALTLSVYADGQLIRTVGPYISRFNLNTSAGWQQIRITANDATIQVTDSVTIVFYDQAVTPPLLPAFGVSSWGGGSVPNALVAVNPGDQILAWQVQQLVLFLTGQMAQAQVWGKDASDMSAILPIGGNIQLDDATAAKFLRMSSGVLQIVNAAYTQSLIGLDDSGNLNILAKIAAASASLTGAIAAASATLSGALDAASANIAGLTIDTIGDLTSPGRISSQHCGGFNQPLTTGVTLSPPALISSLNAPANSWFEVDLAGIVPPAANAVTVTVEYAESATVNSNPAIYLGDASTSTIWIQSFSLNANRAQITATVPTAGFLGVYIASGYGGAPSNSFNVYVTHYEGDS